MGDGTFTATKAGVHHFGGRADPHHQDDCLGPSECWLGYFIAGRPGGSLMPLGDSPALDARSRAAAEREAADG